MKYYLVKTSIFLSWNPSNVGGITIQTNHLFRDILNPLDTIFEVLSIPLSSHLVVLSLPFLAITF